MLHIRFLTDSYFLSFESFIFRFIAQTGNVRYGLLAGCPAKQTAYGFLSPIFPPLVSGRAFPVIGESNILQGITLK
jgi:hypothetical protein